MKRKPLLKILVILGVSLVSASLIILLRPRQVITASHIEVEIGVYKDTGEQAAMETLAKQIKLHPKVKEVTITWFTNWTPLLHIEYLEDQGDRHWIVYERLEHRLADADTGGGGGWTGVTDEIIRDIARKHGTVWDLPKYGCPGFP